MKVNAARSHGHAARVSDPARCMLPGKSAGERPLQENLRQRAGNPA